MTPEDLRQQAVDVVDRRHGYTIEFASDPWRHSEEYDDEERRLTGLQET